MQFFCKPVLWANITFCLFFASLVLYPFLEGKSKVADHVMIGLQAIGVWISVYLICFSSSILLISLVLFIMLIGILPFLPFGWIVQIIYNVAKAVNKRVRITFCVMLFLPVIPTFYHIVQFEETSRVIAYNSNESATMQELADAIPKTYMGERITGLHFKYHTRFCEYDGWRPPLHDPMVVIAMEFSSNSAPLAQLDLRQRVQVYRLAFPDHQAQVNCTCATAYGHLYEKDTIFDLD